MPYNTPINLIGGNCVFMNPTSNNDILLCFYIVSYPRQIQSKSFNLTNFDEINEYFNYY